MNTLDKLQTAAAADTKAISFRGADLCIRRLSAQDGIQLEKLTPQAPFTAEALTAFYIFAISKSLCDEAGQLDTDSDEGRAALAKLPFVHLTELGEECVRFGGPQESKKNESGASQSDSLSGSALPSESNTPTA